jgi:hypothetical protein
MCTNFERGGSWEGRSRGGPWRCAAAVPIHPRLVPSVAGCEDLSLFAGLLGWMGQEGRVYGRGADGGRPEALDAAGARIPVAAA